MNERISIDPKVCHGQAVVKGTRIPVSFLFCSLIVTSMSDRG